MKKSNLNQLVFGLFVLFAGLAQAQENVVRIPLKTLTKPAYDLVGLDGKKLSVSDLKSQFDKKQDLSKLNPIENKFWQNTDLASNQVIDQNLHNQMPTPSEGLVFDSFVGVVRELGMYAINVRPANNPNIVYRLKSGLQVHSSLLKAALLRKIGIHQESPKYYQSVKLKFKSLAEMNSFIVQAFCVSGPDETAVSCLSVDPESRGFLSQKDETNFTVMVHGSYLEKMNAEVPNLFDGLTPSNENTISLYAQSRAYRALVVPYVIADVGESVNRFSPQSVAIRGGWAYLNFAFSTDFDNITSYDDARWILRKMSELTDADWNDIVAAASFPAQLNELVKAKLLHRYNNMMESFFSKQEREQLVRVQMPSLKVNSGDGVVVDGKVMTQTIAGYPQRFSHGDRQSPFESGDFLKLLKVKGQSLGVETALSRLSDKLQKLNQTSQDIVGIEVGPNGVRPLVDAEYVTLGVNATANRIITTGTFYGSQAAVQMVDSLTLGVNAGYIHILDGLNGIDTAFGGGVSYIRNFVHVTPIASMNEVGKIPLKDLYVPSKLKKLTNPLKDGKLNEFLNNLKVGEVFTITDSVGLSGRIGWTTALDALLGFASVYSPTVGFAVDGNAVILRQIQFVKTNEGLQVYIRNNNSKAFGLEFNVNYFINLLKIRHQTTKLDIKTQVYMLNYNAQLISKVDNLDIVPDEDLQKKVDNMRAFGNKAALALRALIYDSDKDALEANFRQQKFEVEHEIKASELKVKLLWFRSSQLKEEHLLTIKKPEVPTDVNGVKVVNEPVQVVTYKKGRLKGSDKLGFLLEVGDGILSRKLGANAPSSLGQASQNPTQVPFGKAEWTTVRSDTELTQNRPGALPSVAVIEHVWGGWSLKQKDMQEILTAAKEQAKGINFADYPLVPQGALSQVKKVDFFRVTSHLSVLPEGIKQIKDLMLSTGQVLEPVQKRRFINRLFQKLSEKLGDKAAPEDQALFKNLVKIIGNGDENVGQQLYMAECRRNAEERQSGGERGGGSNVTTYTWLNGTSYECLEPWAEKLIKLSRKFPANDLREQNKWLTEVLYVLDEKIPQASLLNYLGAEKFIYYLEVTGFRSGDEDGDDGVYVSNVYGEPSKKHPYANGLISVFAEKSKINVTELDQTAGGF